MAYDRGVLDETLRQESTKIFFLYSKDDIEVSCFITTIFLVTEKMTLTNALLEPSLDTVRALFILDNDGNRFG